MQADDLGRRTGSAGVPPACGQDARAPSSCEQICRTPQAGTPFPLSEGSRIFLGNARWALGFALVVESALQFLLKAWSEVLEVVLFSLIVGSFAVATALLKGVRGLLGLVTDTWTQRLAALFLGALALTFLWGDQTPRSMLALARLPSYLIIIAMVVAALREKERVAAFGWTVLASICAVYALAVFEFLFGSAALALECADVARCASRRPPDWSWPGIGSFGLGMESFAYYAAVLKATLIGNAYGMSRLGMLALLAYGAGMAILLTAARTRFKGIAGALVTFVLCGLILTGSRSGTLTVLACAGFLIIGILARKAGHFGKTVKTLVLTNLLVFSAVGLFWLALPSGITSLDRLTTYMPPGESYGFLDGVVVGRAGLVRDEVKPVVVLRVRQVALDEVYEMQMRSPDPQGNGAVTAPIVGEPEAIGDGRSDCGDGTDACGDIMLSWLGPADWSTPTYEYRLRARGGEWLPWRSFVAQPRYDVLDDLRLVSSSDSYAVVLYEGALGVDSGRTRNWALAWDLFVESPLIGNGFRTFQGEVRQRREETPRPATTSVHSGYLSVLAEAGLLGSIPFLGLLAFALFIMFRADVPLSEPTAVWRLALAGVFVAMLLANAVDIHSWDRFFWLVLAFAAVLERWRKDADAELELPRA